MSLCVLIYFLQKNCSTTKHVSQSFQSYDSNIDRSSKRLYPRERNAAILCVRKDTIASDNQTHTKVLRYGLKKRCRHPWGDFPEIEREHIRISGTENEYGIGRGSTGELVLDTTRLPQVLQNGGYLYHEVPRGRDETGKGHLEYCTPEVSNAVSATAYHEAGKMFCLREKFSPMLYCNNTDWRGKSFGAHESYFCRIYPGDSMPLLPYMIARTVFTGSGWFTEGNTFEISQRAPYMQEVMNEDTTGHRGILNLRDEAHAALPGWYRLHFVCGDANMCEVAHFLKTAITSLVIEMHEKQAAPAVSYKEEDAIEDLHGISRATSDWYLKGLPRGRRGALEFLWIYMERARELCGGRDFVTDAALSIFEYVLDQLGRDPSRLWGWLDWPTKRELLDTFRFDGGREKAHDINDWLRAQDLQYHCLDPETGLYYFLRDSFRDPEKKIARIVSDELIERAIALPPADTRAKLRGEVARHLKGKGGWRFEGYPWAKLYLMHKENGNEKLATEVDMSDPTNTYMHLLEGLREEFK